MSRQHATPLLVTTEGVTRLAPLPLGSGPGQISEAALQQFLHDHPDCLPIEEIDPLFAGPVPICTELNTNAGPIDNLLVTASGLPVLVECKLWRNPQQRREVVAQILDYAKELTRWSSSDLQREVARRVPGEGNPIVRLLRESGFDIDEIGFNDALTHNLRRGRFLLLIVGDGIREGVEAIAEYLQVHAGLHFSLGLVELPLFVLPNGDRFIVPRVMARTTLITREVIALPEGLAIQSGDAGDPEAEDRPTDHDLARRIFFEEVVGGLKLDDPDQPFPRVSPKGWLSLYLPAPASSCWISVLDKRANRKIGVRLTSNINTLGEAAIRRVVEDWPAIRDQLGGHPELEDMGAGRFRVHEFLSVDREAGPVERQRAIAWLRQRINDYVTVFRPRIRNAIEQIEQIER